MMPCFRAHVDRVVLANDSRDSSDSIVGAVVAWLYMPTCARCRRDFSLPTRLTLCEGGTCHNCNNTVCGACSEGKRIDSRNVLQCSLCSNASNTSQCHVCSADVDLSGTIAKGVHTCKQCRLIACSSCQRGKHFWCKVCDARYKCGVCGEATTSTCDQCNAITCNAHFSGLCQVCHNAKQAAAAAEQAKSAVQSAMDDAGNW